MVHMAIFSQTRYGRCGWVASGDTFTKIEHSLDGMRRQGKNPNAVGLVGYQGAETFLDAVKIATAWEDRAVQS